MSNTDSISWIAGWAQTDQALAPLARMAFPGISPATTSVSSLLIAAKSRGVPADTGSPSVYATALAAQLAHRPQPATLIGWSMGGMVALETAIRFPELVGSLVLISACARFEPPADDVREAPSLPVRAVIQGMHRDRQDTLRRFLALIYSEGCPAELLEESLSQALDQDAEHLVHGLRFIQDFDLRSRLSEIRVPTLIIHGRRDQVIGSQASQLLHAGISGSQLWLVDGADHGLVRTGPAALAPVIRQFLRADSLRA